jgi:hypothetical protein
MIATQLTPNDIERRICDQQRERRAAMIPFVIILVISVITLATFMPMG